MFVSLTPGCFGGGPHGPAVIIVPPVPVSAQTNPFESSLDWRGVAAYPVYGDPSKYGPVRHDAYEQIAKACDGAYEVWEEGDRLTYTEIAEANRRGVTYPTNDIPRVVRFTCIPKPSTAGDANSASDPNKSADPAKKS